MTAVNSSTDYLQNPTVRGHEDRNYGRRYSGACHHRDLVPHVPDGTRNLASYPNPRWYLTCYSRAHRQKFEIGCDRTNPPVGPLN